MNLIEYPDREMMFVDLANTLAEQLTTALAHQNRASLAVPGGSTPGPVFDVLSGIDIDWSRVDVLLTDERRVPPDHERSNERLIRERLLTGRAASASFLRLVPQADDVSQEIESLTRSLPISVLLLGMGADMHTASLFPGAAQLETALQSNAPPLMLVDASEGLEPRITLTAPALTGALSSHVLITGAEKRAALDTASRAKPIDAPIALILKTSTVHWAP